jgi:hypothetical protein
MPRAIPGVLVELKIALSAAHPEIAPFDTALPATAGYSPAAIHGLDLKALTAPAKYAGEVLEPPLHHLHCFIIDLPAHSLFSFRRTAKLSAGGCSSVLPVVLNQVVAAYHMKLALGRWPRRRGRPEASVGAGRQGLRHASLNHHDGWRAPGTMLTLQLFQAMSIPLEENDQEQCRRGNACCHTADDPDYDGHRLRAHAVGDHHSQSDGEHQADYQGDPPRANAGSS